MSEKMQGTRYVVRVTETRTFKIEVMVPEGGKSYDVITEAHRRIGAGEVEPVTMIFHDYDCRKVEN